MAVTLKKINKWSRKNKAKKLIKASTYENTAIRIASIEALGSINDEDVINTLVELLRDTDNSIRLNAAKSLGNVGTARTVEFLRFLSINDEDESIKEAAINSMQLIKERADEEKSV